MSTIDLTTKIAAPRHEVFDLSRSIDLHSESMAESAERAVGGVTSGLIEADQEVTWEARHFGLTFHMTSRIVEMERPDRFVDEQTDGPFRSWRHVHTFEDDGEGTSMADHIEYELRFGFLGTWVDRLVLRRYMTRLIAQRNTFIESAAESS